MKTIFINCRLILLFTVFTLNLAFSQANKVGSIGAITPANTTYGAGTITNYTITLNCNAGSASSGSSNLSVDPATIPTNATCTFSSGTYTVVGNVATLPAGSGSGTIVLTITSGSCGTMTPVGTYSFTFRTTSNNNNTTGSYRVDPRSLSVIGANVTTRPWDGTTNATISAGTLSGVICSDAVSLTTNPTTGNFSNALPGTWGVTPSSPYVIGGAAAGNYTLSQPSLTGTITQGLPVELLNFSASCEPGNNALIEWSTASEHNNWYFKLESSNDGQSWELLSKIPGAGNSTELKNYSYTDRTEVQTSYYRLTQVDTDGKETMKGIVGTSCKGEGTILTFPNPSDHEFFVQGGELRTGIYKLEIMDSKGEVINERQLEILNGAGNVSLNELMLKEGVYLIRLSSENYISPVLRHTIR